MSQPISSLMQRQVCSVGHDDTMQAVEAQMAAKSLSCVPVLESNGVVLGHESDPIRRNDTARLGLTDSIALATDQTATLCCSICSATFQSCWKWPASSTTRNTAKACSSRTRLR